jgi:hypothetical protein
MMDCAEGTTSRPHPWHGNASPAIRRAERAQQAEQLQTVKVTDEDSPSAQQQQQPAAAHEYDSLMRRKLRLQVTRMVRQMSTVDQVPAGAAHPLVLQRLEWEDRMPPTIRMRRGILRAVP